MDNKKTRSSARSKRVSSGLKVVDAESRNYVIQSRIDALESDFYESPNRLAEDQSEDDYDFEDELDDKSKKIKKKKKVKTAKKKARKDNYIVRNLNLKKVLREEGIDTTESKESKFPNFENVKSEPPKYPARKFCSICGNTANYTCPRCGEKYCNLRCHDAHKEIMCLKFDAF